MQHTFKEYFDKYELLFTPLFLILILISIILYMPQLVVLENFDRLFILPLIIGSISGIIITIFLDRIWKQVSFSNISDFLKLPTLLLILLSSLATLIVSYDVNSSIMLIGFGLGNMFTLISVTSFVVYYRTYLKRTSNQSL